MGLRKAAQRAPEMVELLLVVERDVRRRVAGHEPAVVGGAEALLGVVGDLLRAPRATELVDARVLGDLVDPRLEGDRAVGLSHAPQRRHEHVLGDVLSPGVVVDHAVDVGGDPPVVALVEALEGAVIPRAHRCNQLSVGWIPRRRRHA